MENEVVTTVGENNKEATSEQVEKQAKKPTKQTKESLEVRETAEDAVVISNNPQVALIVERNEAVAILRKRDCNMLTELKKHLAENIRLHGILNKINAEIARLKKLMQTPKPKIKAAMLFVGILLILAGCGAFAARGSIGKILPSGVIGFIAGIGVILVAIAVILKVVANKKWTAYMEELSALLDIENEKAEKAQSDIDNYWNNSALPYISSIIPDRFPAAHVLNYNTVCGMLNIMENLRADTIKEAINLYDEISHRARVEASFSNMEASLYETARNSARSAAAAERSAAANEAAAASAALTAASAASIAHSASRVASASEDASRAVQDSSRAIQDSLNNY